MDMGTLYVIAPNFSCNISVVHYSKRSAVKQISSIVVQIVVNILAVLKLFFILAQVIVFHSQTLYTENVNSDIVPELTRGKYAYHGKAD